MPVLTSRPWRRLALPLVALGMLGLAACGTTETAAAGSPAATSGATAEAAGSDADAREQFRSCLAENGVTLPEGDGPQDGAAPGRTPGAPPAGTDAAGAPAPPAGSPTGARPDAAGPDDDGTPPAPPGVDATAWSNAMQACAELAPARPS